MTRHRTITIPSSPPILRRLFRRRHPHDSPQSLLCLLPDDVLLEIADWLTAYPDLLAFSSLVNPNSLFNLCSNTKILLPVFASILWPFIQTLPHRRRHSECETNPDFSSSSFRTYNRAACSQDSYIARLVPNAELSCSAKSARGDNSSSAHQRLCQRGQSFVLAYTCMEGAPCSS